MAKNNQKDDFQSYNQDWEHNRNRNYEQGDYNQGNYGNVGYEGYSQKDKSRMAGDRNYRNTGSSPNFGGRDRNDMDNEYRNDWKNVSGGYGSTYGNDYRQEDDWNRGQGQWRDTGNYGQSYGTSGGYNGNEDKYRGMSGNRSDNYNSRNRDVYGDRYNTSNDGDRNRGQENIYGGDTSN